MVFNFGEWQAKQEARYETIKAAIAATISAGGVVVERMGRLEKAWASRSPFVRRLVAAAGPNEDGIRLNGPRISAAVEVETANFQQVFD